jgi:oxalate decarboxylase/phosphoglucose isomerase-like protein (cupin superfamily)
VRYCLNGTGRQTVEDTTLEMAAGDLVFVPSGARHSLANPSDEPLRLLIAEQMPGTYRQVPAPWRDHASAAGMRPGPGSTPAVNS